MYLYMILIAIEIYIKVYNFLDKSRYLNTTTLYSLLWSTWYNKKPYKNSVLSEMYIIK